MTVQTPLQHSVLIVEDEELIAEEIRDRLERLGWRIVAAVDTGEKAIAAAKKFRPDLILMDIRIKGEMDGITAAQEIHKQLSVPVVYLTAHSDPDTVERAGQSAPFGYVLKPFKESDLMVAIEMTLFRFQIEQRLKESEQKYATTLASIGDAVIATDKEGRVTFMNAVAETLTQWRFAEANGKPVEQVYAVAREATGELVNNPVRRALQLCQTVRLDEPSVLLTRNGEVIPIDDSAAPILSPAHDLTGAVVAFRDVRQRRLAEDALHRAQEELRHAQRMEAIGRLAGGVAHDFNNLLMVINGCSEFLLESKDIPDNCRPFLEKIQTAGERAAALTQQLLAYSRKQFLRPEVLSINALIANVQPMLLRIIGEDIVVNTVLSRDLSLVRADASQLEQIIMNLVINARDAMPHGGQLSIETQNAEMTDGKVKSRPEMIPGRYVMLAITDTGCGMDQKTQDLIFEPFFTTKDVGKGTGLGLSTVYGIVKQSGGFIYVYSELGKGSSFKIYLPVHEESPQTTARPETPAAPVPSGHETILLVEDDDAVREISSTVLRGYGYDVLTASSGEEAIHAVKQAKTTIHLVVTDLIMPKMSGSEVAKAVKAIKPDIRVLYISGYTDDVIARHGVETGERAFLQKPHTMAALAKKVRDVLDH